MGKSFVTRDHTGILYCIIIIPMFLVLLVPQCHSLRTEMLHSSLQLKICVFEKQHITHVSSIHTYSGQLLFFPMKNGIFQTSDKAGIQGGGWNLIHIFPASFGALNIRS